MRVLVFGAGAIGTYIGGSLALQKHSVTFIEREQPAAELRQRGLFLRLNDQEYHVPNPQVVTSVENALAGGDYDVALFAMKSFDTAGALQSIFPFRQHFPPILSLQNGVENEGVIEQTLGNGKAIAASVTTAVGRRGIGNINVERLRGVGIAAGHPLSQALVSAMQTAGLNASLFPDAADMKWSKMLTNLLANASSAILDMPPAAIFAHPQLYALEVAQLRETLAVMKAQNIHVVDLPRTHVRVLAMVAQALPSALSRPFAARVIGKSRGGKMPSFHIDLHNGRGQSEVDFLNGAVVRFGERFGVSTPVNRMLNDTLLALSRGELPLDTYAQKPEKWMTACREAA